MNMYYGAQYFRPPFPAKECWQRDLDNMKALSFNYIKLWAVWNWIEPEKGQFDFSELDELVRESGKRGLQVVINFIPEGAPFWTDTDEDGLYRTADDQKIRYGGPANIPSAGWPGRCMHDPEFRGYVETFIETTARHFSQYDEVVAYDVWNEPHLEPMYDYRSNMLCYCPHSIQAFRSWLKKKYGTVEKLGKAWYRKYTSWEEVNPPRRFGTWADMIDWRRFWLEELRSWLRIRVAAARRGAPEKPVQTHVAYSGILGNKMEGGLANELGDEFLLAPEVDMFGLSSFPIWLMGREHMFRHFITNEIVAASSRGKVFYQVELQGGGGKPGLLGGCVPAADDVRVWNYNTIAAGGKGSVYWQYAPEPAGVESPGFGLTGFEGENTPRSIEAGRCARELDNALLDSASIVPSVNAIYISRDTDLLTFSSERREWMYSGSLSGAFEALYRKSIPVRFFHQDDVDKILESGIKVLYLPMPLVLSDDEAEKFASFVEQGGTLISEACPGLYHTDGLLRQDQSVITRLFGVRHREVQGIEGWGDTDIVLSESKVLTGRFYRELVDVMAEDVSVLGRFRDGEVAITEYRKGKGRAILIGSYISSHEEDVVHTENIGFLSDLAVSSGYDEVSSLKVIGGDPFTSVPSSAVIRLLKNGERYIAVAVNHGNDTVHISAELKNGKTCNIDLPSHDGKYVEL